MDAIIFQGLYAANWDLVLLFVIYGVLGMQLFFMGWLPKNKLHLNVFCITGCECLVDNHLLCYNSNHLYESSSYDKYVKYLVL